MGGGGNAPYPLHVGGAGDDDDDDDDDGATFKPTVAMQEL